MTYIIASDGGTASRLVAFPAAGVAGSIHVSYLPAYLLVLVEGRPTPDPHFPHSTLEDIRNPGVGSVPPIFG